MPTVCPDINVNRAEALKMIIMAFYGNEYIKLFKDNFSKGILNIVLSFFENIDDVEGTEWYASYVYFGLMNGLVDPNNSLFNPGQPVRREEIAKWITMGRNHIFGAYNSACLNTFCPSGQYCDPDTIQCTTLPECVPTTDNPCEIGGGIDENSCNPGDCTPGETKQQSCGNGGTQTATCNGSCTWGAWGNCTGEGNCTSGQTDSCGNCGTMTCGSNGQWGSCQNQGVCQPGQQ